MAFQLTPLHIPSLTTDYSAQTNATARLGETLGNLPGEMRKEQLQQQKQQILGQIGSGKMDYDKAGRALIALGDTQAGATLLSLGQKQQMLGAQKGIADIFSGGGGSAAPVALGSPNEVENRFIGGVQKAGLTNPNGLAAVAAYGKSESGWSPENVNKTWSDPSESGAAGTSGGTMSWRADRLQNLQNFARQRGEQGNGSPETQAAFLAQEDPTLIPRLNAAKTPQEANQIMAGAWRFAGYDRPGQGEYARREGLTSQYAQRYGNQPSAAPAQPGVQVAENEAARSAPPAQVAQSPDLPPQGANAAPAQAQGFAVPGNMLPPNDPYPRVTTQQLYGVLQNPMASDGQRAMAKSIIDNRMKYSDENAPDKREMTRLQTEKLRREVEGDNVRSLTTAEERARYGVDPAYRGTVQVDRQGRISYPGKATSEVNVNQKGETKFEEELGKKQADRWNGYIAEGDKAQGRLADIQTLRETSRRLGSQGSQANLKLLIGPFAESLGIQVEGLPDIQLYESIANRLAPQMRAPGSGATSDIEFKGFLRAIGPLSNNPAAREMIFDTFEAASRNDLARADIASRLASGDINRGQAEKELRALPTPLEAFREFRKQNPDLVGQAIKESARVDYEQRNAPPITSADAYSKLKPGDKYTDPQGNIRTKR
jgi:hypothetical protein